MRNPKLFYDISSMSSVEDYIASQPDTSVRELLQYLHDTITENPGVTHKIRYKIPFYYRMSWFCYLNPQKDGKVEFVFIRGNELSNIQGILDPRGRAQVSGIMLTPGGEIPEADIREVIQEALLLDETVPYKSKRKR